MGNDEISILDQAVMSSFKKHLEEVKDGQNQVAQKKANDEKRLTGLKRLQELKKMQEDKTK